MHCRDFQKSASRVTRVKTISLVGAREARNFHVFGNPTNNN